MQPVILQCNLAIKKHFPKLSTFVDKTITNIAILDSNTQSPKKYKTQSGLDSIVINSGYIRKILMLSELELMANNSIMPLKINQLKTIAYQYYEDFCLYDTESMLYTLCDAKLFWRMLNSEDGDRNLLWTNTCLAFIYFHEFAHIALEKNKTKDANSELKADDWAFEILDKMDEIDTTFHITESPLARYAISFAFNASWFDDQIKMSNLFKDTDPMLRINHFIQYCKNKYCLDSTTSYICRDLHEWEKRNDSIHSNLSRMIVEYKKIDSKIFAMDFGILDELLNQDTGYFKTPEYYIKLRQFDYNLFNAMEELQTYPEIFGYMASLFHRNRSLNANRDKAIKLFEFFSNYNQSGLKKAICLGDDSCVSRVNEQFSLFTAMIHEYINKDFVKAIYYYNSANTYGERLPHSFYEQKIKILSKRITAK